MSKPVTIKVELTADQAWNFALLLKRMHWSTFERHSDPTDKDEPYRLSDATQAVERAFNQAGFAPR